jgi:hypothetical protein
MEDEKTALGGSLMDLVNQFDEQITHCFKDYNETTESIAPVPVRNAEDLMSDSQ